MTIKQRLTDATGQTDRERRRDINIAFNHAFDKAAWWFAAAIAAGAIIALPSVH